MKSECLFLITITAAVTALWSQSPFHLVIPRTWDDTALADWVTPLAGLNIRPTHISSKEYYALPIENRRRIRSTILAVSRKAIGKCCSTSLPSP